MRSRWEGEGETSSSVIMLVTDVRRKVSLVCGLGSPGSPFIEMRLHAVKMVWSS